MKTSYGLEFDTVTEINPEWSDYDKTIAGCHLANARVVIVDTEYGWKNITAKRRKRIEGYLQDEISTLDNYYTGEVFGYRIMPESDDDNELDSCWGFYGTECMKELEAECRHIIDGQNKAAA